MPERNRPEIRAEIKREKRLKRAQRRAEKHAQKKEVPISVQPDRPSAILGKTGLTLGLMGADYFSRMYNVHGVELLSSYGHDVLGIPLWWLLTQRIFSRVDFFRSKKNIVLPLALSVGFEVMEYEASITAPAVLDLHLLGSARFDPWDFVAYGLGAAATLGLYKVFYGRPTLPHQ